MKTCSLFECDSPSYSRSLCQKHYCRLARTDTADPAPKSMPPEERLWAQTRISDGCWSWMGTHSHGGYGITATGRAGARKQEYVHRYAYRLETGEDIGGLVIDHLCGNPSCVNPEHLRAVTQRENVENRTRIAAGTSSGVRGVVWCDQTGRWRAQAKRDGRHYHGGRYDTVAEAESAAIALRAQLGILSVADGTLTIPASN